MDGWMDAWIEIQAARLARVDMKDFIPTQPSGCLKSHSVHPMPLPASEQSHAIKTDNQKA